MPGAESVYRGLLPWFLPGTVVFAAFGVLLARMLARALATRTAIAWFLVVGVGMIASATLTPLNGDFNANAAARACDLSRIGVAPVRSLIEVNDTSLNIALFVPLGIAIGLLPRHRGRVALIAAAMLLPFVLEAIQLLVPALERGCQSADVVDNLSGLVLGLALGLGARRIRSDPFSGLSSARTDADGRRQGPDGGGGR